MILGARASRRSCDGRPNSRSAAPIQPLIGIFLPVGLSPDGTPSFQAQPSPFRRSAIHRYRGCDGLLELTMGARFASEDTDDNATRFGRCRLECA
jgi:hypothetical protein